MRLSVIILTHNQFHYTEQCLDSVTDSIADDTDVEIIVVDNGSSDNTAEAIASRFPKVRLISLQENYGVARGRNIGIKNASGRHILLLDNDTIINAQALNALESVLDSSTDIGICAPRLCAPDGTTQLSYKHYPGVLEKIRNVIDRSRASVTTPPQSPIEPDYVIGACQMISRQALNKTGLLDESIFFGPEDADLCIRMRREGYRIVYRPEISIIHHWQRATTTRPFSPLWRKHMSALIHFYRKHRRWLR